MRDCSNNGILFVNSYSGAKLGEVQPPISDNGLDSTYYDLYLM